MMVVLVLLTVQKFNPDRGQKLVKKDRSKDDINFVEKDKKKKPKVDKSKTTQTTT